MIIRVCAGIVFLSSAYHLAKYAAHEIDPHLQFAILMMAVILSLLGMAVAFRR